MSKLADPQDAPLPKHTVPYEQLDTLLKVVGIRGWLVLLFFVVFGVATIVWSLWGAIPMTISARCIALDPEGTMRVVSSEEGEVARIAVKAGDVVQAGAVLVKMVEGHAIRAPAAGEVVWVSVAAGELVDEGSPILWLRKLDAPEKVKVFAFVPLMLSQQVHVGMEALTSLTTVNTERYGMIRGRVEQIAPYPASASDDSMQQIPSQTLRDFLIGQRGPVIVVVIDPILDPSTPSHLKWTSPQGPPCQVHSGALGESRITLERIHPFSLLVPKMRSAACSS